MNPAFFARLADGDGLALIQRCRGLRGGAMLRLRSADCNAVYPLALPAGRIERHGGHFAVTGIADRAAGGAKCPNAENLQALNRRAAAAIGGTRENSGIEFPIGRWVDAARKGAADP